MLLHRYRTYTPGMPGKTLSHIHYTRAPHAQRDLGNVCPWLHAQKLPPGSPSGPGNSRQTCASSKRATEHHTYPCSHTRIAMLDRHQYPSPHPTRMPPAHCSPKSPCVHISQPHRVITALYGSHNGQTGMIRTGALRSRGRRRRKSPRSRPSRPGCPRRKSPLPGPDFS